MSGLGWIIFIIVFICTILAIIGLADMIYNKEDVERQKMQEVAKELVDQYLISLNGTNKGGSEN